MAWCQQGPEPMRLAIWSPGSGRRSEVCHPPEETVTFLLGNRRRRLDSMPSRSLSKFSAGVLVGVRDTRTHTHTQPRRAGVVQRVIQDRVQGMLCGHSSSHGRGLWVDKHTYTYVSPLMRPSNERRQIKMKVEDRLLPRPQRAISNSLREYAEREKRMQIC